MNADLRTALDLVTFHSVFCNDTFAFGPAVWNALTVSVHQLFGQF